MECNSTWDREKQKRPSRFHRIRNRIRGRRFVLGLRLSLLMLAASLWFGQTNIQVANRALRIRATCLGFSRTRSVNAPEIGNFELYAAIKSADHVWYDLRIHLHNGATVTAGTGLEKSEAEWFLRELKKDLGLP